VYAFTAAAAAAAQKDDDDYAQASEAEQVEQL
jgi:hypothetical protein